MDEAMQGAQAQHQDDRLRQQLLAEREEASARRDSLVAEQEAQAAYHALEIERCERVMAGCNAALERIDPPKMAAPFPTHDHDQARGGVPSGVVR